VTGLEGIKKVIPKRALEISSGNAVRIIGRWSKSDGEIAEGDIVELLSNGKSEVYVPGGMAHLNIRLHVKFQQQNSANGERKEQVARVLLPLRELGVPFQEVCTHLSEGYPMTPWSETCQQ
jgi:hypothetical protein